MLALMISHWKTEAISKRINATAESLNKKHNEVAISNIVARGDDLKKKGKTLGNILIGECKRINRKNK